MTCGTILFYLLYAIIIEVCYLKLDPLYCVCSIIFTICVSYIVFLYL